MGNLDNRIANPDQLLTQDVEKFCNSVVDLYSNLSKVWHPFVQNTHFTFPMYFPAFAKFFLLFSLQPLLDIGLYIFKLTTAIGAQVRVQDIVIIYCTSMLLDILRIFWSLCTGSCIYDGLPADLRPLPDPSAQADREDDSDRTEVRRRIPIRQLSSHHKQVTCLNCIYFCTTILFFANFDAYSNVFISFPVKRSPSTMEMKGRNRQFIRPSRNWWVYDCTNLWVFIFKRVASVFTDKLQISQ